jgi:hypothetical protein
MHADMRQPILRGAWADCGGIDARQLPAKFTLGGFEKAR